MFSWVVKESEELLTLVGISPEENTIAYSEFMPNVVQFLKSPRAQAIRDHIKGHAYFLGTQIKREVKLGEALVSWLEYVVDPIFTPLVKYKIPLTLENFLKISANWHALSENNSKADWTLCVNAAVLEFILNLSPYEYPYLGYWQRFKLAHQLSKYTNKIKGAK